jgi:hypothetical protein
MGCDGKGTMTPHQIMSIDFEHKLLNTLYSDIELKI